MLYEELIMGYVTLLKNGADETELQSRRSQGNETTITMCVPQNLKDACFEIATWRGMSMSTYARLLLSELDRKEIGA